MRMLKILTILIVVFSFLEVSLTDFTVKKHGIGDVFKNDKVDPNDLNYSTDDFRVDNNANQGVKIEYGKKRSQLHGNHHQNARKRAFTDKKHGIGDVFKNDKVDPNDLNYSTDDFRVDNNANQGVKIEYGKKRSQLHGNHHQNSRKRAFTVKKHGIGDVFKNDKVDPNDLNYSTDDFRVDNNANQGVKIEYGKKRSQLHGNHHQNARKRGLKQKLQVSQTADKKQFMDGMSLNLQTDDFNADTMPDMPVIHQPIENQHVMLDEPGPPEPGPLISHIEEPVLVQHVEPPPLPPPEPIIEHHEPVLIPVPIAAPPPPPPPPCTVQIPVTVHLKGKLSIKMKHCQKCDFSKNIESIGPLKISSLSQLEDKLKKNINKAFKVGSKKTKLGLTTRDVTGVKRNIPPVVDFEVLNQLKGNLNDVTGTKKDQMTSSLDNTEHDVIVRKTVSIPRVIIPEAAYKRGVIISLPKGKAMLKCVVPNNDTLATKQKKEKILQNSTKSEDDDTTQKPQEVTSQSKDAAFNRTMTEVDNDVVSLSNGGSKSEAEDSQVESPKPATLIDPLKTGAQEIKSELSVRTPTFSPSSVAEMHPTLPSLSSKSKNSSDSFADKFMNIVDKDMLVSLYKMAVHDIMGELQKSKEVNLHHDDSDNAIIKSKIKMLNNERSVLENQYPGIGATLLATPQATGRSTSQKRNGIKTPKPEPPLTHQNMRRVKLIDTDRPRLRLPNGKQHHMSPDGPNFYGDMDPSKLIGDRDKDCVDQTCQQQKELIAGASQYFEKLDNLALAPYEEFMVDSIKVSKHRNQIPYSLNTKRDSIQSAGDEPGTIVELFGKLPRVPLKITLNPKGPLAKLREPITIDLQPPNKATHTRAMATSNNPSVAVTIADRIFKEEPLKKEEEAKLQAAYADLRRRSLDSWKSNEIRVDPIRFERQGKRMKIVVSLPKELTRLLSNSPGEAVTRDVSSMPKPVSLIAGDQEVHSESDFEPKIMEYEKTLSKLKEQTKEAMLQLNHFKDPYSDIGQKRHHKHHHSHHHSDEDAEEQKKPVHDPYADVGGDVAKRGRRSLKDDNDVEVGAILSTSNKEAQHFMTDKDRYQEITTDPYASMGTSSGTKKQIVPKHLQEKKGDQGNKKRNMNNAGIGALSLISHTVRSPVVSPLSAPDVLENAVVASQVAPLDAPSSKENKLMLDALPKFKDALSRINPETRKRLFDMKPFNFLAQMQNLDSQLAPSAAASTGHDPYADMGSAAVRSKTNYASNKAQQHEKAGNKRDPYADMGTLSETSNKRDQMIGTLSKKTSDPFADIGTGGDPLKQKQHKGERKQMLPQIKKTGTQNKARAAKKHDPFADIGSVGSDASKRHKIVSNEPKKGTKRDPFADIGSVSTSKRNNVSSKETQPKKGTKRDPFSDIGSISSAKKNKVSSKETQPKKGTKTDPFSDIGSISSTKKNKVSSKETQPKKGTKRDPFSDIGSISSAKKNKVSSKETQPKKGTKRDPFSDIGSISSTKKNKVSSKETQPKKGTKRDPFSDIGSISSTKKNKVSSKETQPKKGTKRDPFSDIGSISSTRKNKVSSKETQPKKGTKRDPFADIGSISSTKKNKVSSKETQPKKGTKRDPFADIGSISSTKKNKVSSKETQPKKGTKRDPFADIGSISSTKKNKVSSKETHPKKGTKRDPFSDIGSISSTKKNKVSSKETQPKKGTKRDPFSDIGSISASKKHRVTKEKHEKKGTKRDPFADIGSAQSSKKHQVKSRRSFKKSMKKVHAYKKRSKIPGKKTTKPVLKSGSKRDPFSDIGSASEVQSKRSHTHTKDKKIRRKSKKNTVKKGADTLGTKRKFVFLVKKSESAPQQKISELLKGYPFVGEKIGGDSDVKKLNNNKTESQEDDDIKASNEKIESDNKEKSKKLTEELDQFKRLTNSFKEDEQSKGSTDDVGKEKLESGEKKKKKPASGETSPNEDNEKLDKLKKENEGKKNPASGEATPNEDNEKLDKLKKENEGKKKPASGEASPNEDNDKLDKLKKEDEGKKKPVAGETSPNEDNEKLDKLKKENEGKKKPASGETSPNEDNEKLDKLKKEDEGKKKPAAGEKSPNEKATQGTNGGDPGKAAQGTNGGDPGKAAQGTNGDDPGKAAQGTNGGDPEEEAEGTNGSNPEEDAKVTKGSNSEEDAKVTNGGDAGKQTNGNNQVDGGTESKKPNADKESKENLENSSGKDSKEKSKAGGQDEDPYATIKFNGGSKESNNQLGDNLKNLESQKITDFKIQENQHHDTSTNVNLFNEGESAKEAEVTNGDNKKLDSLKKEKEGKKKPASGEASPNEDNDKLKKENEEKKKPAAGETSPNEDNEKLDKLKKEEEGKKKPAAGETSPNEDNDKLDKLKKESAEKNKQTPEKQQQSEDQKKPLEGTNGGDPGKAAQGTNGGDPPGKEAQGTNGGDPPGKAAQGTNGVDPGKAAQGTNGGDPGKEAQGTNGVDPGKAAQGTNGGDPGKAAQGTNGGDPEEEAQEGKNGSNSEEDAKVTKGGDAGKQTNGNNQVDGGTESKKPNADKESKENLENSSGKDSKEKSKAGGQNEDPYATIKFNGGSKESNNQLGHNPKNVESQKSPIKLTTNNSTATMLSNNKTSLPEEVHIQGNAKSIAETVHAKGHHIKSIAPRDPNAPDPYAEVGESSKYWGDTGDTSKAFKMESKVSAKNNISNANIVESFTTKETDQSKLDSTKPQPSASKNNTAKAPPFLTSANQPGYKVDSDPHDNGDKTVSVYNDIGSGSAMPNKRDIAQNTAQNVSDQDISPNVKAGGISNLNQSQLTNSTKVISSNLAKQSNEKDPYLTIGDNLPGSKRHNMPHKTRSRRSASPEKTTKDCSDPYSKLGVAATRSDPCAKMPEDPGSPKAHDPYADLGSKKRKKRNNHKRVYLPNKPAEVTEEHAPKAAYQASVKPKESNDRRDPYAELGSEVKTTDKRTKHQKRSHHAKRSSIKDKTNSTNKKGDPYAELGTAVKTTDKRSFVNPSGQPDPYADLGTSIGLSQNSEQETSAVVTSPQQKEDIHQNTELTNSSNPLAAIASNGTVPKQKILSSTANNETMKELAMNVGQFTQASVQHIGPFNTSDPYLDVANLKKTGKALTKSRPQESGPSSASESKSVSGKDDIKNDMNGGDMEKEFHVTSSVAKEIETIANLEKAIATEKSKVRSMMSVGSEDSLALNVGQEIKSPYNDIGGEKKQNIERSSQKKPAENSNDVKRSSKKKRKVRCVNKSKSKQPSKSKFDPYVFIGTESNRRADVSCNDEGEEMTSQDNSEPLPDSDGKSLDPPPEQTPLFQTEENKDASSSGNAEHTSEHKEDNESNSQADGDHTKEQQSEKGEGEKLAENEHKENKDSNKAEEGDSSKEQQSKEEGRQSKEGEKAENEQKEDHSKEGEQQGDIAAKLTENAAKEEKEYSKEETKEEGELPQESAPSQESGQDASKPEEQSTEASEHKPEESKVSESESSSPKENESGQDASKPEESKTSESESSSSKENESGQDTSKPEESKASESESSSSKENESGQDTSKPEESKASESESSSPKENENGQDTSKPEESKASESESSSPKENESGQDASKPEESKVSESESSSSKENESGQDASKPEESKTSESESSSSKEKESGQDASKPEESKTSESESSSSKEKESGQDASKPDQQSAESSDQKPDDSKKLESESSSSKENSKEGESGKDASKPVESSAEKGKEETAKLADDKDSSKASESSQDTSKPVENAEALTSEIKENANEGSDEKTPAAESSPPVNSDAPNSLVEDPKTDYTDFLMGRLEERKASHKSAKPKTSHAANGKTSSDAYASVGSAAPTSGDKKHVTLKRPLRHKNKLVQIISKDPYADLGQVSARSHIPKPQKDNFVFIKMEDTPLDDVTLALK